MSMQSIISDLLTDLNINPVLLDIGASAAPPKISGQTWPRTPHI